jgi:SpoIID/LytB domain protein
MTTTTDEPATNTTAKTVIATTNDNGTIVVAARQRKYRGTVEATAGSGTLRLVNDLDVEDYLKGMGEVRDPSWPPAALRAQAIAARTYALRAMAKGGELCDTQRCQVYLGAQAEYPQMNAAVAATNQKVLAYGKALASAVYSANAGGYSATREEGFGTPPTDNDYPYLRAAPYPSRDQAPWQVTVALTDVANRLGYPAGQLQAVTVTRTGPSGRALEVTLDGAKGPKAVTGIAFDAALGLRSALFTTRVDVGEAPPPPPPSAADAELQAPPDEAAALAATEVAVADDMAAIDELYAAAGAAPSTNGGDTDNKIDPRIAVLASWSATAALGAVMVAISGRRHQRRKRPTPGPSPSAPPAADDSA